MDYVFVIGNTYCVNNNICVKLFRGLSKSVQTSTERWHRVTFDVRGARVFASKSSNPELTKGPAPRAQPGEKAHAEKPCPYRSK